MSIQIFFDYKLVGIERYSTIVLFDFAHYIQNDVEI